MIPAYIFIQNKKKMENHANHAGASPPFKAKYLANQRGKNMLIDPNGYTYWANRTKKDGTTHWVCDKNQAGEKRRARLTTAGGDIITQLPEHTHASDARKRGVLEIYKKAKDCAKAGAISTAACLLEAKKAHTVPAIAAVSDAALGRQIRRWKLNDETSRAMPASLPEIIIPEEIRFRPGPGGEQELFLLHDSGAEDATRFFCLWNNPRARIYGRCYRLLLRRHV